MEAELAVPANLSEAAEIPGLQEAWREYLDTQFQLEIEYIQGLHAAAGVAATVAGRVQFRNPARPSQVLQEQPRGRRVAVSWNGFPRVLAVRERDGEIVALLTAEQLASTRDLLYTSAGVGHEIRHRWGDEYLEWRAEKVGNRLRQVTFTCEAPDYWSALAQGYPSPFFRLPSGHPPSARVTDSDGDMDRVVDLYRDLVDPRVRADDLRFDESLYDRDGQLMFEAGSYDPWNPWNTERGIVHLTHPANTLGEQIELIGDASVLRSTRSGHLLEAAKCLLCCGGYGEINRNSDPAVGAAVNELARQGLEITLANPIGLYMSHLQDSGWTRPDGRPVDPAWWRVVRGASGPPGLPGAAATVRAVYEVPAEERYVDPHGTERPLLVGDLRVGGRRIEEAGEIADAVKMVMVIEAWPVDRPAAPGIHCQPEYRCCRRAGAERVQFNAAPDQQPAPQCVEPFEDAYPVVTASALAAGQAGGAPGPAPPAPAGRMARMRRPCRRMPPAR
jgi:hypothetical protein